MSQQNSIIEAVKQSHEAMKILLKDVNYSSFNQHILLASMTVAYQLQKLNTTLEGISGILSDIAESSDFMASEYEPTRFNKLTEMESHLIKDALTKHHLDSMKTPPEGQEHELAMQRIMFISKGMVW